MLPNACCSFAAISHVGPIHLFFNMYAFWSFSGYFLDRLATHILAFEGDSHVEWFEGNYQDYEADRKKRLGAAAEIPKRIKYRKFTR